MTLRPKAWVPIESRKTKDHKHGQAIEKILNLDVRNIVFDRRQLAN